MSFKQYLPRISASVNRKGVLDIDSVKGCSAGMAKYPDGGCYGLCYAAKMAKAYGYDFTKSVSRKIDSDDKASRAVLNMVKRHKAGFFRIGTMGDPSHDWALTASICVWLGSLKVPVVVTKHWESIPDYLLLDFMQSDTVFNTSTSALDTEPEREHRLSEFNRLRKAGLRSVLRIVSCKFGDTETGKRFNKIQNELFNLSPVIDNPLRIPSKDPRVICGDILTERLKDLHGESSVSLASEKTYIGLCADCPDQCGILTTGESYERS